MSELSFSNIIWQMCRIFIDFWYFTCVVKGMTCKRKYSNNIVTADKWYWINNQYVLMWGRPISFSPRILQLTVVLHLGVAASWIFLSCTCVFFVQFMFRQQYQWAFMSVACNIHRTHYLIVSSLFFWILKSCCCLFNNPWSFRYSSCIRELQLYSFYFCMYGHTCNHN